VVGYLWDLERHLRHVVGYLWDLERHLRHVVGYLWYLERHLRHVVGYLWYLERQYDFLMPLGERTLSFSQLKQEGSSAGQQQNSLL
jgi:hypothetical protein